MTHIRTTGLAVLFLFITFGTLFPNPFGNNPDVIADESYFLTSSLEAIQKHTLPGWEFSYSGNYYGGPQTYLDTVALVPVLAGVFVSHGFSRSATEMWVALHTGTLLHVLRLVNGLLWLASLALGYWYVSKRRVPERLRNLLVLYAFLLLSNVFIIQFLHTAKVWTFYILTLSIVSAFFIAQEYFLSHLKQPFIRKESYVALLTWSSALLFFQNYVGAFSTILIGAYALALGHISVKDVIGHCRRYWYLLVILLATQISFLWRAVFLNWKTGSFNEISTLTPDHSHVLWAPRLLNPFAYAWFGDPLAVMLFFVGVLGVAYAFRKAAQYDSHRRLYVMLACTYPVLTYLFFHAAVGFSSAPRYGILLTLALIFSATILIGEYGTHAVRASAIIAAALFVALNIQAISLYWKPSTEVVLLNTIEARYNTPDIVFIEEPSALRLTLPVNQASFALLDEKRRMMSRFAFLLQHQDEVANQVSFKPIALITYTPEELSASVSKLAGAEKEVWTISTDCATLCSVSELASGSCFAVRPMACGTGPQEVNLLPQYLAAAQLGSTYIVRRVR